MSKHYKRPLMYAETHRKLKAISRMTRTRVPVIEILRVIVEDAYDMAKASKLKEQR